MPVQCSIHYSVSVHEKVIVCACEVDDQNDHIHNYAKILCHFGSLLMEFMDGWAEGDSERVIDVGVCFCHPLRKLLTTVCYYNISAFTTMTTILSAIFTAPTWY